MFSATIATTTISAHAQRGTDGAGERQHMLLGTGGSLQSKRFHAALQKRRQSNSYGQEATESNVAKRERKNSDNSNSPGHRPRGRQTLYNSPLLLFGCIDPFSQSTQPSKIPGPAACAERLNKTPGIFFQVAFDFDAPRPRNTAQK